MNAATRRDTEFQTTAVCEKKHASTILKLRGVCVVFIAVMGLFATLTIAVYAQCRDILQAAEETQGTATRITENTAEKAAANATAIRVIESALPRIEKGVDAIQAEQVANRTLLMRIATHKDGP